MGIIIGIIVGALSGWLAGKIMDSEFSMMGNILLGIGGGVVGSFILGFIGIHGSGLVGNTIVSVIGACVLIAIGRAIKK